MSAETVLISGASSGIGEELARCFAKAGHDLVLVARNEDKLATVATSLQTEFGINARIEPADLSQRSAPQKLAGRLAEQGCEIDILVNNAGVLEHGRFADIPARRDQQIIDLNISGLTGMLNFFLRPMIERGHGRVLNVASIAAFQPVPSLATYAATKAYVLSLTESLAEELEGTGVTATALCPGITSTSMVSDVQRKSEALARLPDFVIGDPEEVAREGFRACMHGEVICIPGLVNRAATLGSRAVPRWLLRRVTGIMGRYSTRGRW